MSYGYNASIIGTTLGQPSFIEYMGLTTRSNGTDLLSSMNGVFQTGGVIGTLILPTIADKYGRKKACASACVLLIIAGAVMTASVNVGMFIAFRSVSGAGTFMILVAVPILMNEIVPVRLRGAMVDIHAVLLVLRYAIQGWVGFGFYFWKDGGSNTWRPPMALTMLWPLCMLIGLPFIPDSPRWLCMKGREEEAEKILLQLHADPSDLNNDVAKAEFYQIRKQIAIDRTLGSSWAQIWKKPFYRKRASLPWVPRQPFNVLVSWWSTFVFGVFYGLFLDGTQFSYLGELFPTHLRAKGVCLGVATISLMNIVWLQSAPVAFASIGWKFYLVFIIPGTLAAISLLIFFPDTKGLPLEEIAALSGNEDEIAVYQSEIGIDANSHAVIDNHGEKRNSTVTHIEG